MMADLFEDSCCLLSKEVLDNVFVRDFLKQKEIPFIDKGKRYLRHYLWEPQGGVTKIKIGYKVKGKFEGAIVYVNYSKLSYDPYVVVLDKNNAFDSLEIVADMVARALSWAFKGTDVTLNLEPWIPAKGEKIMWGRDCMKAHDMGDGIGMLSSKAQFGLENLVNVKQKKAAKKVNSTSPQKKKDTRPTKYSAKIIKGNKRRILRYLHSKIDELEEPKDIMRVVLAAIAAGVIGNIEYKVFQAEFNKKISSTSYNTYIREKKYKFLNDDLFDAYYDDLLMMK